MQVRILKTVNLQMDLLHLTGYAKASAGDANWSDCNR